MRIPNRLTTSIALGVADMTIATEIASAMMGTASLQRGAEREITDHMTLRYLRAFDASNTEAPGESSVWVDFSFRFDRGAEASVVTDWLIGVLGEKKGLVVLRFDNTEVDLEAAPLRRGVDGVLRKSVWEHGECDMLIAEDFRPLAGSTIGHEAVHPRGEDGLGSSAG